MKKFYDTEHQKIINMNQLINEYSDLLLTNFDEYSKQSFDDFLRNCMVSNNGTLKEITALSETEKTEIFDAAYELKKAVKNFCSAVDKIDDDSFNAFLAENYPFKSSLDEMYYEIDYFYDDVYSAINHNRLFKIR